MTQVCRALRLETLAHFHGKNSFAFPRQDWFRGSTASKHSWKWNYDVTRTRTMYLERWLKTRPTGALPFLTVMLTTKAECAARHHDQIRRAHYIEPEPHSPWALPKDQFRVSGEYWIMLDFADSRSLKLVASPRCDKGHMTLHDCQWCVQRVEGEWNEFTASDEWRSARDNWHDKLDAGTLSWKDALNMIDMIREVPGPLPA